MDSNNPRDHEHLKMNVPDIAVHSLRRLTTTSALLNDANPTRVQKMVRHQHEAMTEIYGEEAQKLLEGAEDAAPKLKPT